MSDVLVVAEVLENKLRSTTLSAITFAKQVNGLAQGAFDVLVIGAGAKQAADEAAKYGARKVFVTEVAGGYTAEGYAPTVAKLVKSGGYKIVAATASTYGKDLLPYVAGLLDAAYACDVLAVAREGSDVAYRRAMYAGNVLASVALSSAVHVVSVRQTEFKAAEPSGAASAVSELAAESSPAQARVKFVSAETVKSSRPELTEARVVVSGGRALKSAENFKTVLEPLVDVLGAAMGASRAACDAGYVANDLQVGQTGKVVAPQLYIAVGISGAIQHLAGMKGSKVIVAINKDKEAPIAQVADYFLVADLFDAVPKLAAALKRS